MSHKVVGASVAGCLLVVAMACGGGAGPTPIAVGTTSPASATAISPTPLSTPTPASVPVTTPTPTPTTISTPEPALTSTAVLPTPSFPTATPVLTPTPTSIPIQPALDPVPETCVYEYPSEPESPRTHLLSAVGAERFYRAPDPQRISLEFDPSADLGPVRVTGAAGAVQPCDAVFVGNLELGDFVTLFADAEGAFEAEVDGVPGTHVMIGRHPGWGTTSGIHADDSPTITLLRLPVQEAAEGVTISTAYRIGFVDTAPWIIRGTFASDTLEQGQEVPISGRVILPFQLEASPPPAELWFSAVLLGDAQGRQVGRGQDFVTPFLTATGLPIEVPIKWRFWDRTLHAIVLDWEDEGERWVADFTTSIRIPSSYRAGLYELTAKLYMVEEFHIEGEFARMGSCCEASLGNFTIGNPAPMRLATTLLADVLSEGSRGGILAREDVGAFDISPRVLTRHDPVIPRLDGFGKHWTYRLEPYLPMFGAVERQPPAVPPIPLNFSDSELMVVIARPDGKKEILGPAPLTRYVFLTPRAPCCFRIGGLNTTGGHPSGMPQLQGDDATFAYQFPLDGDYVITLKGHIADHGGRVYEISGTYDVTVANVLDIETAMLPGTPFEVGDSIAPTLTIMPGVPAEVTFKVTHVAADGQTTTRTFSGRANKYGWWDGDGAVFIFQRDGEYRVDAEARYTDPDGDLWAGRMTFGSAVATPDAPIIAHGRRGSDAFEVLPPAWFFRLDHVPSGGGHLWPPFFTGDIQWGVTDNLEFASEDGAIETRTSVQIVDDDHPLIARAYQYGSFRSTHLMSPEESIKAGQVALITHPNPESGLPGMHPDEIDLWAYMYGVSERPGVRVRELIDGDGEVDDPYWFFDDGYNLQSGNGVDGDLPGDFKFQYAAAVIRDDSTGEGVYAIYGSGWVFTPDEDPLRSRVMPPFQGASGGPNGGPLFTVHGREIDMFFLPLGVRPGAVLETGDIFRLAGPIMPTLPSRIDYTVIAPDGTARSFDGRANAIGYFYDPNDDFAIDQSGLWKVELTVTHDGMTSAGPVQPPYPTGGPLTPDGTTFTFVVVDSETSTLEIETDLTQLMPHQWYSSYITQASFEAALPNSWGGETARVIVTMPGIVPIDEDFPVHEGIIKWYLDGPTLHELANNFDYEEGIADTITVTFYAEDGAAQAAGAIVTHGARLPIAPTITS